MSVFTKINTEWNFKELISEETQDAIDTELKKIEAAVNKFVKNWKENDEFLKNPIILKKALDEYEELHRKFGTSGKVGLYIHLKRHIDSENTEVKARYNKIDEFGIKMSNEIQFFELRLAKISEEKQREFLSKDELVEYNHFLERLFAQSKHLLSEPEEKILNLKEATSMSNWTKMTSEFLAKQERYILTVDGKKEKVSFTKIMGKIDDKNKAVRDSAAAALNDIFRSLIDVGERELNSVLANKKVNDELRNYSRPDIERHLHDDIDTEVVDSLVETVSKRFDIPKKFYELKAKLLGLPKLAYHERNLTYGNVDKKYSYKETLELVYKVLNDIDPEFGEILKKFNDEGQIDVFPRKGKDSGAFCTIYLTTTPTYIMLNHNERLNDVLTLAHETGHGINHELMKKQNQLNYSLPISTAEVASTFMEDFVLAELMKSADEEMRLALMMMKLNDDVSTIFRQIACYKVETDLHAAYREKGFLSKEEIGEIFLKNMKAYMGDFVSYDEGSENWWLYWSHIRYFFYVYAYSSGLLISKSLQNEVKNDPEFIQRIKEFLRAGSSKSPKEIFAAMGLDITDKNFWNKGLDEVEVLLKETEELARKLGVL